MSKETQAKARAHFGPIPKEITHLGQVKEIVKERDELRGEVELLNAAIATDDARMLAYQCSKEYWELGKEVEGICAERNELRSRNAELSEQVAELLGFYGRDKGIIDELRTTVEVLNRDREVLQASVARLESENEQLRAIKFRTKLLPNGFLGREPIEPKDNQS